MSETQVTSPLLLSKQVPQKTQGVNDDGAFKDVLSSAKIQNTPPPQTLATSSRKEPLGNVKDLNNNSHLDFSEIHNASPMSSEQIGQEIANSLAKHNKDNKVNIVGLGESHNSPPVRATTAAIKQSIANGRSPVALIEIPKQQFEEIVRNYNNGSINKTELKEGMEKIREGMLDQKHIEGLLLSQKAHINKISDRIIAAKEAGAEVGVFDVDMKTTENRDAAMFDNVSKKVEELKTRDKPSDLYILTGAIHAGTEGDPNATLFDHKSDRKNPLLKRLKEKYDDKNADDKDVNVLSVAALPASSDAELVRVPDYNAIYILQTFEKEQGK